MSQTAIGHLLFEREGTLMAQPFDERRLELAGDAVPVAEDVNATNNPPTFSASSTGVLAYRAGGAGALPTSQLT